MKGRHRYGPDIIKYDSELKSSQMDASICILVKCAYKTAPD